jgi:outer membrane protein assembly factor BamB
MVLAATGVALLLGGIRAAWISRGYEIPRSALSTDRDSAVESAELTWPGLRGPSFDSHSREAGLAESWPEDGPPVVWTRELGQGYSGFAAVGNRVFTQTQTLYRQSLICLEAETGEPVWAYSYGWPYDGGGLYPGPRSTPTWYDGRIYFSSPDGTIACVTAEHGTPVWSCNPKKAHRGRGTDFGYASSPVIIEGRVIVPVGGNGASVVALDAKDGTTIWTSGDSSASYATPLPIRWNGRSLVVTPLENSMAIFDIQTGRKEWEAEFSTGYDEHSAAPLYHEPFLVMAAPFKAGAKQFQLIAETAASRRGDTDSQGHQKTSDADRQTDEAYETEPLIGSAKLKWENPKFSNDVASSVLVDGRIYGFDLKDPQSRLDRPSRGEFRCLDFETGRIVWSTNRVGQANAIVADHKLILFTDSGELILAALGTDEYSELARTQVFRDETCWTYPALLQGCIFLRTQTRAACLYLGKTPWESRRTLQSVRDIPRSRSYDAKLLIGGEREFPATVPEWSEFFLWYGWSLAGLFIASGAALLCLIGNRSRVTTSRLVFWGIVAIIGILGSPIVNARQGDYVLLWPLALWAAFQMTINVITWAERQPNRSHARWLSRVTGVLFIGTCLLYFHLCRSLGYAIEWSFLVGFLLAFPVAALASRLLTSGLKYWPLTDLALSTISFSAYFWFSVIFIKWKLAVGT